MIQKVPTGVEGFDAITSGGLPANRATLVMGGPGSGKTVFALQTLVNGARLWNEPGIFVAFEENSGQIVVNAATFGWDLTALENEKLFFLDARLGPEVVEAGDFEISGILAALGVKARDMGARRIVFDGVDVLLALLDDPQAERREIYRLHYWLQDSGLTGIITAKVEGSDPFATERYSFMQFMADCVVVFHHRLSERVSLRSLRVAKYRGSGHSADEFPLVISATGMQVAGYTTAELVHEAPAERVSSGIDRLDAMIGGGYYRGSCVLVSGAPGTAKTTLGGAFLEAACLRGERALFISFDESAEAIVRNLSSVGINLGPHVESGLLRIFAIRTSSFSAEEHYINVKALLDEHQPLCMVVDPMSALNKMGGHTAAADTSLRMVDMIKGRGATLLCTSMLNSPEGHSEATPIELSTIADSWIHLSYVIRGGERNRALTVIKARGTSHSNQVRELLLSDEGVTLADVYVARGEVLMGTSRWEREAEEHAEEMRLQAEVRRRRQELEAAEAETRARIEALQREMEYYQAELSRLESGEQTRRVRVERDQVGLLRKRDADPETMADRDVASPRGGAWSEGRSGDDDRSASGR